MTAERLHRLRAATNLAKEAALAEMATIFDPGHRLLAAALEQEVGELLAEAPATDAVAPPPPEPRLTVDLKLMVAVLDGTSYEVKSDQALRWIDVLAASPNVWLSAKEAADRDAELDGMRSDRLRRQLPAQISELIDSETGRGSRIRLTD